MIRLIRVLWSYFRARRLVFDTREALLRYQKHRVEEFRRQLVARSPYYRQFAGKAVEEWPESDKSSMLANFDAMNTAGLRLQEVFDTAMAAEQSRDFRSKLGDVNVGLSSGTSGQRAAFAISDKEAAIWAGVMLARMLPDGLLAGERVALFLRANNNVYESVRARWLSFRFFDLFNDFEANLQALSDYRASILVAPAQVLREIALRVLAGNVAICPKRVISVAEVLDAHDRRLLEQAFPQVHEVYQATEGFLASTCEQGRLHLNEEYLMIEPRWLDAEQRRFVPVITDFTRLTQPFVRYRLDDVLIASERPCECGRVTRALDAVEGRCDDALLLPGRAGQRLTVFADVLTRVFARNLPRAADYALIQRGATRLSLHATLDPSGLALLQQQLCEALENLGVQIGEITWESHGSVPASGEGRKRRRIRRESMVGHA
ncbi:MAG: CoF synthetase [Rhodocyclaceae bacterium]